MRGQKPHKNHTVLVLHNANTIYLPYGSIRAFDGAGSDGGELLRQKFNPKITFTKTRIEPSTFRLLTILF